MQIDIVDPPSGSPSQRQTASAWDGNVGILGAPRGATQVASSSANQANANAVATLPAAVGKTTYVTGMIITAGGSTAAAQVIATLTGVLGGTMSIPVSTPAGATLANAPIVIEFAEPIPAAAVNTALVLTLPALGAGNTAAAVTLTGFQV